MKMNDIKQIERQLTPDCEFHASAGLVDKIMAAASEGGALPVGKHRKFNLKPILSTLAVAASVLALLIVVKPGGTPALAAEKLFAGAAAFFDSIAGYSIEFEVRTKPQENFAYANPANGFVTHSMDISSDGRWRLDKEGRVADYDGKNIYVWFPESGWGWKFDADYSDAVYPYDKFLDLGGMMSWLEQYASGLKGTGCRKVEDEKTVRLIIKAPAQGDYANDYLKGTSVEDCDTRHTYVFSKEDGRLLSARIDARYLCFYRTILELTGIEYDKKFAESAFSAPGGLEWIDQTGETIAGMEKDLPVGEFVGISAEEAVKKLSDALRTWNEPMLKVIMRNYPIKAYAAAGYKGCTLAQTGDAFKSGRYHGVFVPCEIRFSDGSKRVVKLALRNDRRWNAWELDGGI